MSRASQWQEVAADTYLDHRHRNWVLAEEQGDVVYVRARGVVLVHRARAEHVAVAFGVAEAAPLGQLVTVPAPAPLPLPPVPAPAPAPRAEPLAAGVEISRHRDVIGWLGILAGAAVFVTALAVPLDDPALVMALGLLARGARTVYVPSLPLGG